MHVFPACLLVLTAAGLAAAHITQQPPIDRLRNCPPLWSGSGQDCLRFFKQPLPWQQASDFCAAFSSCATGGVATLVKVDSRQSEARLERFLDPKGSPTPPVSWLGLGDPMNTGRLTWPDGTTPASEGHINFGQGGRNGNCVVKDPLTNQWGYAPCAQANPFICQMDRNPAPPQQPGRPV